MVARQDFAALGAPHRRRRRRWSADPSAGQGGARFAHDGTEVKITSGYKVLCWLPDQGPFKEKAVMRDNEEWVRPRTKGFMVYILTRKFDSKRIHTTQVLPARDPAALPIPVSEQFTDQYFSTLNMEKKAFPLEQYYVSQYRILPLSSQYADLPLPGQRFDAHCVQRQRPARILWQRRDRSRSRSTLISLLLWSCY